mgnify:CR=1 FL=1
MKLHLVQLLLQVAGQPLQEGGAVGPELTGYENITSLECSDDGKTITTTYDTPYADWQGLFGGLIPAQVVEADGVREKLRACQVEPQGGPVAGRVKLTRARVVLVVKSRSSANMGTST